MMNLNVIAIDLAKNNYQVCKIGQDSQVIYNKEVSRQKLLQLLASEKQSLVAMESCGGVIPPFLMEASCRISVV